MSDDIAENSEIIIGTVARGIALAAAQNDLEALERASTSAAGLLQHDMAILSDHAPTEFFDGAYQMSSEIVERLREQLVPKYLLDLGQKHRHILQHIFAKPGISIRDLADLTATAIDEESSPLLNLLYSHRLIEPTQSEGGLKLTYWGERTFAMVAPSLFVQSPNQDAALSTNPPVSKLAHGIPSKSVNKLEQLLKHSEDLELAMRSFYDIGRLATELCTTIDVTFGFEFSAVQLIRPEENTIETIAGSGIARRWVGHVKHRIEDDWQLRDIQADIVKELKVEVIVGDDDQRLDPFIKKVFGHKHLSRVFVPLLLVRDSDGHPVGHARPWVSECDEHNRNILRLRLLEGDKVDVIGTVETGFSALREGENIVPRNVTPRAARRLAEFVMQHSWSIYRCTLKGVLERVAEMARKLAESNIATLQWGTLGGDRPDRYWHTVCVGVGGPITIEENGLAGAIGGPPRETGLGSQALLDGQPKYAIAGLDRTNRPLSMQGVTSTAVVPSEKINGPDQKVCLIYMHYFEQRDFTDEELSWVHHLARRSGDLLRTAMEVAEGRDRERQLAAMHRVAVTLSERDRYKTQFELLWFIAWATLNLRGADVVTIYEYDSRRRKFIAPPVTAGRLREPEKMRGEAVLVTDAPMLVLRLAKDLFVDQVVGHVHLDPHDRPDCFVTRERIVSCAALRLDAGGEFVGLMFVNYRESHEFKVEEKEQLMLLASLSASALKNFISTSGQLVSEQQLERLTATSLTN